MKSTTKKDRQKLKQQANIIAAEIFNLINQYTNDSATSKFFLPDELNRSFYITAGGFASVVYAPILDADDIQHSYALLFFLVLLTYGFQIYVKERSIRTNASPFRLPTDINTIEKVTNDIFAMAEEGVLVSSELSDAVIEIIVQQIEKNIEVSEFSLKNHTVNFDKVQNYTSLSLYYGYNIAAKLID